MTKNQVLLSAAVKTLKVVLPAILGALGGVIATAYPAYFASFCGV